jgi:hypothetical protein
MRKSRGLRNHKIYLTAIRLDLRGRHIPAPGGFLGRTLTSGGFTMGDAFQSRDLLRTTDFPRSGGDILKGSHMGFEMIIEVDKTQLLSVLEENRVKHRTVFLAALEGYRKEAIRNLNAKVKALSEGRSPNIHIMLDRPEDHTRDYDRVIGMLKMDKAATFRLDQMTYGQYVNDDWSWKRQWAKMSSSYANEVYNNTYTVIDQDEDDASAF